MNGKISYSAIRNRVDDLIKEFPEKKLFLNIIQDSKQKDEFVSKDRLNNFDYPYDSLSEAKKVYHKLRVQFGNFYPESDHSGEEELKENKKSYLLVYVK